MANNKISLALTSLAIAFVYSFLVTALLGLIRATLPMDFDFGYWELMVPVIIFFILLMPAVKIARRLNLNN